MNRSTISYGVAVTPDGSKIYVTNSDSDNISVIDPVSNNITATVVVGSGPNVVE